MIINKISNINFRNNNIPTQTEEMTDSHNAILMLRDPNASVKFQQNQEMAQKADSLSNNPFKALGYKLYRTFSLLSSDGSNEPEVATEQKELDVVA